MNRHQRARYILDRLIGTSVVFNGVLIPASMLTAALARYVDNLSIWNDHEIYKVSLVGSTVPIKFAERYFVLCTNHQLRGCQPENVSLLGRDGKMLITSAGVRHFNDDSNPYYLDLAAFDFTEPCEARQELKERFFALREVPPDCPATDIVFAVVAGFPSGKQRYELEEKNHIGKVKRIVVCRPEPASYDPALLCLRAEEPLDFDPNGMSGGSAFVVQAVAGEFRAYFAGLVVTGGKDQFHIIKAGHIWRFLRTLV
ncbi:hypothetical protein [Bradyrhizobium sp. CCGE-LA001]|uniref:hypothetical protein n=1 Tax=Bradyrhizobium sp. CCGE-LA001 TaxID=1223566 RepID=UPI0002AAC5F0|nr:hypothetical protein [Bradyrhizobium sp. CCGE-LA001]